MIDRDRNAALNLEWWGEQHSRADVAAGEAEGAILAGMGGRTIAAILGRGTRCASAMRWLVLQPQQRARDLERWLAGSSYRVRRADWAAEGGRLYRVLLVEPPR